MLQSFLEMFAHSIVWQMHTMGGIHNHIKLCPHRLVDLLLLPRIATQYVFAYCVPGDATCTSSGGHDTASVVGGILSLVIILISGVAALVIILLILRIRTLTLQ